MGTGNLASSVKPVREFLRLSYWAEACEHPQTEVGTHTQERGGNPLSENYDPKQSFPTTRRCLCKIHSFHLKGNKGWFILEPFRATMGQGH